ncbi:hypothetical protein PTSG_06212 [Salpingoeca rosetta]|uniref:Gamma-glutamylcyclotransferase n=1 Tax=Salpingoeca rosetta (strain ATCC 50818 / BSB-021) TaxID=946362 RepID=F2UC93_SALR5|nr:uncharacterized protein PTSG_06212 [Salpingoeca rosetta]EGD74200.1 hypothetical protein PTSG_06212 [Salpingoeca rosetta]|eukprot:XP_004993100.1 hypothetical protein PTSG_06212 [Salpingoeca rosetta]
MAGRMSSRVWYASYGSNMCRDRLLCYIQGGKLPTMSPEAPPYPGCRDTTHPASTAMYSIPYRLYFARNSKTWHRGGICFVDHREELEEGHAHHTLSRVYDITLDQFNDIVMQENAFRRDMELTHEHYEAFCSRGFGHSHTFPVPSWYNTVVCVGQLEGRPVLTFTCSEDQHDQPRIPAAASYLGILLQGLQEADLHLDDAVAYLAARFPHANAHTIIRSAASALEEGGKNADKGDKDSSQCGTHAEEDKQEK